MWRLAITSAIVCGASLRRKTWICSGGVRRRNSNGRRSIVADRRPMSSSARDAPSERSSICARVLDAALGDVVRGQHRVDGLAQHLARDVAGHLARLGDLERERLDLGVAEVAEDLAGALLADGDEQDRGLLDARAGTWRRRGGALGRLAAAVAIESSAIHCLTWAATRSGSRSISWSSACRSASGVRGGSVIVGALRRRQALVVRCSSSASATGSSISLSHAGEASVSLSRRRRWRRHEEQEEQRRRGRGRPT